MAVHLKTTRTTSAGYKETADSDTAGAPALPMSKLTASYSQGANSFDYAEVILVKWLLAPVMVVATLRLSTYVWDEIYTRYLALLGVIAFLLAAIVFDKMNLYRSLKRFPILVAFNLILIKWILITFVLSVVIYVANLWPELPWRVLATWGCALPITLLLTQATARKLLRDRFENCTRRRGIIIGGNRLGVDLFKKITDDAYLGISIEGYFDDRVASRLPTDMRNQLLGKIAEAALYVKEFGIDQVFITLPIHLRHRLGEIVEELKDTTASVYFVPDMFLFDLVQARMDQINGVPVVAVRDTPFTGMQGLVKRLSDIVIAGTALVVISPLLLLIALGVKLSSPGPILFKQRRYGLDGDEIKVYKFRSMTVCEDGGSVTQAVKNDARVTRFGAFLRRTSLDELPQLYNVLQGRMSMVGPRPHAVAHNELYRKVISGYMIRHKVRPGITGWAQVNGLRGETDTVEKMQARVAFDIDYIRHWSLGLDIFIILKTARSLLGDQAAY